MMRCLNELPGHSGSVRCLAFLENTLLSGSTDGTVRLWDFDSLLSHGGSGGGGGGVEEQPSGGVDDERGGDADGSSDFVGLRDVGDPDGLVNGSAPPEYQSNYTIASAE